MTNPSSSSRIGSALMTALMTMLVGLVVLAPTASEPAAAAAPTCRWIGSDQRPTTRANELIDAMTLNQKVQIVTGVGFLTPTSPNVSSSGAIRGIPELCIPNLILNDSSGGIGFLQSGTTAFPQGITQASTWNPRLIRRYGGVLADEAVRKGANVVLGPGLNLARNPLNGRNLEYGGEDPHLTGVIGAALVRGLQSRPVLATAKHFVLNEQEANRMTSSSDVDERTLHELYLAPFEAAVKAGVGSIMCSYNRVHSIYACEHPTLLNEMLKGSLGFRGFVMSDFGATHSTAAAANAGLDMEMTGDGILGVSAVAPANFGDKLAAAVRAGAVSQARLDGMLRRIFATMFREGLFDHPPLDQSLAVPAVATTQASLAMARRIAVQGSVLLKNKGGILPLTPSAKQIAVIGAAATKPGAQIASQGFGSNHVPAFGYHPDVVAPLGALRGRAAENGASVVYDSGAVPLSAALAASLADVAIVFVDNAESEGQDRSDLAAHQGLCNPFLVVANALVQDLPTCLPLLSDQDALVKAVAEANPNTIVVLQNGGPLTMPWLRSVRAVVENWYPGQVDGDAVTSLLFGDTNFSGKLPVTFPKKLGDGPLRSTAQYPGVEDKGGVAHVSYSEGLNIGYRWYDARRIKPLFPFGFGLSYTRFAFSGLKITPRKRGATVSFSVTNVGTRRGAEVAQVYLKHPRAAGEPLRQLEDLRQGPPCPRRGTTYLAAPGDPRVLDLDRPRMGNDAWLLPSLRRQLLTKPPALQVARPRWSDLSATLTPFGGSTIPPSRRHDTCRHQLKGLTTMKADELISDAQAATGLSDFGDDELFGGDLWREGLEVLLSSLDREAQLHDMGEMMVQSEISQYLANRLRIVDHHRRHPQIRDVDVTPPIVIVGQARTGTTMLFDLLAQDPQHRVPQTWEVDAPLPPPRTETYLTDPRIAAAEATFELVDSVIPEFRAVHQLGAQLAQECVRITASSFASAIFPTQYRVPSYLQWLLHDAVDGGHITGSYTWHRRFLELLQSEAPGNRWLIKTPFHCWTLPQLMAEYPSAILVQTHRDPARVMASTTSLLATLRKLGTSDIAYPELAEEFFEIILGGLERTVEARLDGTVPAEQVADVQFSNMMNAPIEEAERVYARFGWDFTPEVREAMEAFRTTHVREGAGHPYTFAETELSLDRVRQATERYSRHFDVPEEPC